VGTQPIEFCREIEAYLCRKNDGHLIRITGPSFDLVSSWAERGVPLKVAFGGIDRYFDRYYAKGPRRRPVRIDFCDADVLDLFDEWRRATGVLADRQSPHGAAEEVSGGGAPVRRGPSLPAHMERALRRLTTARAGGALDQRFDDLIDRVAAEFDLARSSRGDKRQALIERLAVLDRELLTRARTTLDPGAAAALAGEAEAELAPFRASMPAEAYARAREAALDRLVRDRIGLPTLTFY
jgi:hypothetical protein